MSGFSGAAQGGKTAFLETLDKLYWRSKEQRRVEFCDVSKLVQSGSDDRMEMDGESDE